MAYPNYNGTPACDDCHPGFIGGFGGPLHQLHYSAMTNDCQNCHINPGDNPPLSNCAGCHVGTGLRLHHTNAGAPPDGNGLFCATCHPGDPAPPPENVPPPYYFLASVFVQDPCFATPAPPGEDFDGDGLGLDNDGDLLYDQNDPDCSSVPTEKSTWGRIKALYDL
jgi:hypothetical protein